MKLPGRFCGPGENRMLRSEIELFQLYQREDIDL